VNYYQVLGIDPLASPAEIRKAYRGQARKYHPDLNPGADAAERFKEVTVAYEILSDPKKRSSYDATVLSGGKGGGGRSGASAEQPQAGAGSAAGQRAQQRAAYRSYREQAQSVAQGARSKTNTSKKSTHVQGGTHPGVLTFFERLEGIWDTLSISFRGGRKNSVSSSRGPSERNVGVQSVSVMEVLVTVPEAITGINKTVEIDGRRFVMVVPPGVRTGSIIRLRSKKSRDEVIVLIRLAPHPFLSIHPRGLVVEVPISIGEAYSGAKIRVPTLDGEISLKVPKSTQSGREVCLKGKGIMNKEGERGDIFYRMMIHLPEVAEFQQIAGSLEQYYQNSIRQRLQGRLIK
jgi:DnaJ-class molecular chaperone